MLKKSEFNFVVMVFVFLFGLTNFMPSEISVYDQHIIPYIEQTIKPGQVFYSNIIFLISFFRVAVILATLAEGWATIQYGRRYGVFGLR